VARRDRYSCLIEGMGGRGFSKEPILDRYDGYGEARTFAFVSELGRPWNIIFCRLGATILLCHIAGAGTCFAARFHLVSPPSRSGSNSCGTLPRTLQLY